MVFPLASLALKFMTGSHKPLAKNNVVQVSGGKTPSSDGGVLFPVTPPNAPASLGRFPDHPLPVCPAAT